MIHKICTQQSLATTYSTSIVDKVVEFCFFDLYETRPKIGMDQKYSFYQACNQCCKHYSILLVQDHRLLDTTDQGPCFQEDTWIFFLQPWGMIAWELIGILHTRKTLGSMLSSQFKAIGVLMCLELSRLYFFKSSLTYLHCVDWLRCHLGIAWFEIQEWILILPIMIISNSLHMNFKNSLHKDYIIKIYLDKQKLLFCFHE